MNKLSSQDRSALIRLASSLPVGSEERKVILAGLQQKVAGTTLQYMQKYVADILESKTKAKRPLKEISPWAQPEAAEIIFACENAMDEAEGATKGDDYKGRNPTYLKIIKDGMVAASKLAQNRALGVALVNQWAENANQRTRIAGLHKTASMLHPGPLTSSEEFEMLKPGDQITIHRKPAVVIEYDSFDANLIYAWKGTSVKKVLDARDAWAWEPGEIPGTSVSWIGPGAPVANVRRAPRRPSAPSIYD